MSLYKKIFLVLLFTISQYNILAQGKEGKTLAGNLASGKNEPAALEQLINDANLALKFKPVSVIDNSAIPPSKLKNDFYSWAPYLWPNPETKDGYPYITKDGQTNPDTEAKSDKPLLRNMAVAVHTLALAYYYTNDIRYAQKAVTLIRTWFLDSKTKMNSNLNYAQCIPGIENGSSTGIIDSRWFILVIDAIGLIEHSPVFSANEEKELKNWFKDYLVWLLTSENGLQEGQKKNNHGTWYAAQIACYALFIGNRQLTEKIITSSKLFFNTQIDSMGRQTFELNRSKSFDYSLYNIHALITLAMIGDLVNIDLWHQNIKEGNKKNILESIRYLASFATSDKTWPFQQITEKAISLSFENGNDFSVYYPYDLYSALLIGYKKYHDSTLLDIINKLPKDKILANRYNLLIMRIKS